MKTLFAAMLLALTFTTGACAAPRLFWGSGTTNFSTMKSCLSAASDVASYHGLTSIEKTASEVAGYKNNARVIMTCVERGGGQKAIGVVMVASESVPVAQSLRDEFLKALQGVIGFD